RRIRRSQVSLSLGSHSVSTTDLPAEPVSRTDPPQAIAGRTVLLVEDDDAVRQLIAELLQEGGFLVLEASGPEAADHAMADHAHKIDVLLTDVAMPGINGPQLFAKLRHSDGNLKGVFMSGYSAEIDASRYPLPTGAVFIEKPFDKATLISTLQQVCTNPR
ncbi:MAG TPA: response regulator, partial [Candidatus Acidoferrum sp.]|nr:response regulator [Candidatus Acidoferrum sp.]